MELDEVQKYINEIGGGLVMRKSIRIILLLMPLLIIPLALYEHDRWESPLNPNIPQPVSIETLFKHNESYKAPMELIVEGEVHNKSEAENILLLKGIEGGFLKVNCSGLDISAIESGTYIYMRGYSYIDDNTKNYFLAIELHIHVTYSLILSLPGALLVLIILFIGFKFKLGDFSFSRKAEAQSKNA
jgi:hypothetical protein